MNLRQKKKNYNRAEEKLAAFRTKNNDKRSYCEIARQENVLTPKEKSVFLKEQEKWIRITHAVVHEIETDEMRENYESIQPMADPDGFQLFRAAESILGKFDYAHFPYEDNRGFFEDADGHTMFNYLLVQHCAQFGEENRNMNRWSVVAPGYEECISLYINKNTPEYKEFAIKLYTQVLQRLERKNYVSNHH